MCSEWSFAFPYFFNDNDNLNDNFINLKPETFSSSSCFVGKIIVPLCTICSQVELFLLLYVK